MVAALLSLPGNYVAKFAHPRSGQTRPARAMLILDTGRVTVPVKGEA